jgi:nitrite reductase (NADH) large subunit
MNTEQDSRAWRCTLCGFIHRGGQAPDYCPVCGASTSDFETYSVEAAQPQKAASQWRCLDCGYIHDGPQPPAACPVCGASPDRFEAVEVPSITGHTATTGHTIIVGGGIAGVAAAEAIRQAAPNTGITLLCEETHIPYYRLNLTRYLAGEIQQDALPIHAAPWYVENAIDLLVGTSVTGITPEDQQVHLTHRTLHYDRLILTPGSHAFTPPIPGGDREGVMTLRTREDADVIRARVRQDGRCLVIGGGILGLETAGALARQGAAVTLIESHDWLMPRQLNCKAAHHLETRIKSLGITVLKRARTRHIHGNGKTITIELDDGTRISAGTVILATGVRPNTALARKAGLNVNRGIVVDSHLQTSACNVYAAGDAAEHNGRLYGSWAPSQYQGRIAGLNTCGIPAEFGGLPRANALKVLGIDLFSVGQFEPEDGSYAVLDDETDGHFAHFAFRDGRMVGAILIGHPLLGPRTKQAIEAGTDFSEILLPARSGNDVLEHLKGWDA